MPQPQSKLVRLPTRSATIPVGTSSPAIATANSPCNKKMSNMSSPLSSQKRTTIGTKNGVCTTAVKSG